VITYLYAVETYVRADVMPRWRGRGGGVDDVTDRSRDRGQCRITGIGRRQRCQHGQ